jgi:acetyltransferase-like isoleucine patch superfamily enzyme
MRNIFKQLGRFVAFVLMLPFIITFSLSSLALSPENKDTLFTAYSQFISLFPGKVGAFLRAAFYRVVMQSYDPSAHTSFATLFSQVNTKIASGVYIGPQCNIGKCNIGEDTLLGSAVHIMSGKQQHIFEDIDKLIREQGGVFAKINVGKNCWIGNGALVMANVGDDCIIAAGSVVISDIPNKSIVAGNPGKVIKTR